MNKFISFFVSVFLVLVSTGVSAQVVPDEQAKTTPSDSEEKRNSKSTRVTTEGYPYNKITEDSSSKTTEGHPSSKTTEDSSNKTTAGYSYSEAEQKAFLEREAQKELKIGLKLYQESDDYRAITALKRYRILDARLKSVYFSNLIIGQIYQRNNQPELSTFAFENALRAAPDPHSKTFSYLLANQQSCVALSFYFDCAERLEGLKNEKLGDGTRDLVDYQSLFVDVVLRKKIEAQRAKLIRTPLLQKKAEGLLIENQAFEDLNLKSPVLSGVLSGVLPGAGQLYNGRYWDALLSLSFNALFAGATYYSYVELDNIPLSVVSGLAFLGFYIGNITNAVTDSQRINADRYLQFFENLKSNYWARVHFQIDDENVSFGYRFDWPGPRPGIQAEKKE